MTSLARDYKGYHIELEPRGDYCSSFAMTITDEAGKTVFDVKTAGDTEQRAFERGQEFIDTELALH